ncbi:hypothetical protein [Streptomyces fumanus]|uniref:Uncharacterized protein n=1 Tax=Streptomyces fumanus TaxID=67302 RepID=A0A919EC31_9ACTN|nr:hypothetical protein [Streptomyces fumanus]GHF33866.1 hypothetical protein GCM10018772_69410 [Streptomyces fumanus]
MPGNAAELSARVRHDEAIRRDRINAVLDLGNVISTHRQVMWKRGDATRRRAGTERLEALRDESHMTRRK